MNKPVSSPAVTAALRLGGVVLFEGGKDLFRAGPKAATLSLLIELIAKSKFSHSAVLLPGAEFIYECTIENGVSGPQSNSLVGTLEGYGKEGGHAWLYNFQERFTPDWGAVDDTALRMMALRKAGLMPYNVARLFDDAEERSLIFDLVALPADGIITYVGRRSKGLVCCEEVGFLVQAGGVVPKLAAAGIPWLPTVVPPGQPIGCSPQDIASVPMFEVPVQLL